MRRHLGTIPSVVQRATCVEAPPAPAVALDADVAGEVASASNEMVKRLRNSIEVMQKQIRDPAEAAELQSKGDALNTMPKNKWHRGLKEIEVPDYSRLNEDGTPCLMRVELDPKKDFHANAKLCFKQAGKILRGIEKVGPLVAEKKEQLELWQNRATAATDWQAELSKGGSLSIEAQTSVAEFREELMDLGLIRRPPQEAPHDPEKEAELKAFRFKKKYGKDIDCFRSPSGFEVIAGRSSDKNEHVSLKLAKGDMMWFHTDNGIPGSHVLIKAAWDEIEDEDIEFAASIAAYHSKGKESFHVPVMYCRGGEVKKMPGSKKGSVYTTGKKYQITVQPKLPEV